MSISDSDSDEIVEQNEIQNNEDEVSSEEDEVSSEEDEVINEEELIHDEVISEVISEVIGEVISEVIGEVISEVIGEVISEVIGEVIGEVISEVINEVISEEDEVINEEPRIIMETKVDCGVRDKIKFWENLSRGDLDELSLNEPRNEIVCESSSRLTCAHRFKRNRSKARENHICRLLHYMNSISAIKQGNQYPVTRNFARPPRSVHGRAFNAGRNQSRLISPPVHNSSIQARLITERDQGSTSSTEDTRISEGATLVHPVLGDTRSPVSLLGQIAMDGRAGNEVTIGSEQLQSEYAALWMAHNNLISELDDVTQSFNKISLENETLRKQVSGESNIAPKGGITGSELGVVIGSLVAIAAYVITHANRHVKFTVFGGLANLCGLVIGTMFNNMVIHLSAATDATFHSTVCHSTTSVPWILMGGLVPILAGGFFEVWWQRVIVTVVLSLAWIITMTSVSITTNPTTIRRKIAIVLIGIVGIGLAAGAADLLELIGKRFT